MHAGGKPRRVQLFLRQESLYAFLYLFFFSTHRFSKSGDPALHSDARNTKETEKQPLCWRQTNETAYSGVSHHLCQPHSLISVVSSFPRNTGDRVPSLCCHDLAQALSADTLAFLGFESCSVAQADLRLPMVELQM